MAPPVRPSGGLQPADPLTLSPSVDASSDHPSSGSPVASRPPPPGGSRTAPTADRLGSGMLDPARVEAARRAMGDQLPIISPPSGDWTKDITFNVWIRRFGLVDRLGDAALMTRIYGVFLLLQAKTVDPFLIPTDRPTSFSSRSIDAKYLATPARARFAFEAWREVPSRRIPLNELTTASGDYFTLDEIKVIAAFSWWGVGIPLYGVRIDHRDPQRRVHSMVTADFSESVDLSMMGYSRAMVIAARNGFNEASFEDIRQIRAFFDLFKIRADAGVRLALTREGRLFVGNAGDMRFFEGKGPPLLFHVFNLAADGLIPPEKLPEDLAVWLYVGLPDILGVEER